jgi:hypothetical protein
MIRAGIGALMNAFESRKRKNEDESDEKVPIVDPGK